MPPASPNASRPPPTAPRGWGEAGLGSCPVSDKEGQAAYTGDPGGLNHEGGWNF